MADPQSIDGPSTSQVSDESSESTVELNIKTLDSQIYTFEVDKNVIQPLFPDQLCGIWSLFAKKPLSVKACETC